MVGGIEKVGKYELLRELGHGATAVVYLAKDTNLRRQVALKRISADAQDRERILDEARLLQALRHPNIVQIHSADATETTILVDMEYIAGGSVKERLISRGAMPWQDAVRIAVQVLAALEYAHRMNVLHRDVKPANILLTESGEVRLADFGVAEILATHGYAAGGGTFAYMAPEDFDAVSHSDCRSDLWAVGITLYEMLTRQRPFSVSEARNPFLWSRAIRTQTPLPVAQFNADIPVAVQAVLDRAIEKDRSLRYASAPEFSSDLTQVLAGKPVSSTTMLAWERRQEERGHQPSTVLITTRTAAPGAEPVESAAGPGMVVARVPDVESMTAAADACNSEVPVSSATRPLRWAVHLGAVHAGDTRARLAWARPQREGGVGAESSAPTEAGPHWLTLEPVVWRGWFRLVRIRVTAPTWLAPTDRRFEVQLTARGTSENAAVSMQILPLSRTLREAAWWFMPLLAMVMAPMVTATVMGSGTSLSHHLSLMAPPLAAVTGALALMLLLVSFASHLDFVASAACGVVMVCAFATLMAFAFQYGGAGATASLRHGLMAAVLAGGPLLGCCLLQVFYPTRWRLWAAAVCVGAGSITAGTVAALSMLR